MHRASTSHIEGDLMADGVVCVRGALSADTLAEMAEFFDYVVAHPGPLSKQLYPDDDATTYTDFFNPGLWTRFRNVFEHTEVPDIIRELWRCEDLWLFFEQVWWKTGGVTRRTPWHQDASYTPIAGMHSAIAWIPLDPVPLDNALEFVRGSHLGSVYATSNFDAEDNLATELDTSAIPPLPDIQQHRDDYDIVSWETAPGDLVVFHFGMLHGGGKTDVGTQRRTISLRYFGPDAVFEPLVEGRQYGNQSRGTAVAAPADERTAIAEMLGGMTPGQHYSDGPWPKLGPVGTAGKDIAMTDNRVCLASGDGHVGCPTAEYRDYLERRLHPAFDAYLEAHTWRWSSFTDGSYFPPDFHAKFVDTEGFDPTRGSPIASDPAFRLKALDGAGIACEILNPDDQNTNDPPFGSGLANAPVAGPTGTEGYGPDLVRAGARAYNRWLAGFCSADPTRLRGLTVLGTLDDVNWCVDEIDRAYESGLTTGILLPLDYYLPTYHHPRYEMLWQACEERNLAVEIHVSKGHPNYLGDDPRTELTMYGFESNWYAQRPLWSLMFGGVLERHPDLRLVFTEMGVEWVAPLLARLDRRAVVFNGAMNAMRDFTPSFQLSLTASEYWERQCFVTHSITLRRHEFEGEAYESVPNMVWGADIGHAEGIWPTTGPVAFLGYDAEEAPIEGAIRSVLDGLSAEALVPYLQDHFFAAYANVDRAALDDVVARIGPTPAQLGLVTDPGGGSRSP